MNDFLFQHTYGETLLRVYSTRAAMGYAAAQDAAEKLISLLQEKPLVSCLFAAAPSQQEFLDALAAYPGIDWQRVIAFQMDEYIGLPKDSEATFAAFLKRAIFDRVPFGAVHLMQDYYGSEDAIAAYTELINKHPLDIVFLGIGENGHIAFNDPGIADFSDPQAMKVVQLDAKSRQQQVHDGCFPTLDKVPTKAYTLTIPVILSAGARYCIVPNRLKAPAVKAALEGPITQDCPASILQNAPHTRMYIDKEAAILLKSIHVHEG